MNKLEGPVPQILDAVAEAEGGEPVTVDPPLAGVVGPDAMGSL